MKRVLLLLAGLLAAGFLLGSLGLWLFLSRWVPVQGKARLIEELERAAPVDVSIGAMRYELIRGLILDQVAVVHVPSQETWLIAPQIQLGIGWGRLLVQGTGAFRATPPLEAPRVAVLSVAGTYGLKSRSLAADVRADDIPLASVAPVLKARLPEALSDGMLRLRLRFWHQPEQPPVVKGEVAGSGLAWTTPAWRLTGDLVVAGEAARPVDPHQPWSFQGTATLRDANLTGLLMTGPITNLQGRAQLSPERVEIEELTGDALGSPWRLEGTVRSGPAPAIEAFLRSRVALAALAETLPALRDQPWTFEGAADLQAVCRSTILSRRREDGGPEAGRNQPGRPREGPFLDR